MAKLGLKILSTNIRAQKINGSIFQTFEIVLASFQVMDKLRKTRFFQKIFLLTDTSIKVILNIIFPTFSNIDILFVKQKLIWRLFTSAKTLLTIKQIEFIDKKEFVKAVLDKNFKLLWYML